MAGVDEKGPEADAKRKAFGERIRRRQAAFDAREKEKLDAAHTKREDTFAYWLSRLWEEAYWIHTVQQFPNGKPLIEQSRLRRQIWMTFISAMEQRMWGSNQSENQEVEPGLEPDAEGDVDATAQNIGHR